MTKKIDTRKRKTQINLTERIQEQTNEGENVEKRKNFDAFHYLIALLFDCLIVRRTIEQ